jgi:hypothetical protein
MKSHNLIQVEHSLYVVEQGRRSDYELQDGVTIAEIGKEIVFDPSILYTYHFDGWKSVHHDLLVVCAAVEFADRRYTRGVIQWSRRFLITIPVLELDVWQQPKVQAYLSDMLKHLTGDNWRFSFVETRRSAVINHRQRSLDFGDGKQFTIAYSDGLDSRCVSGIYDKGDAVRVRISKSKDKIKKGDRPFDLIPFEVKLKSRESGVRSRGFKFAVITAIAGHISGVSKIIVPESGQGALGPVLFPLHNVYADYRNYPTFFRKMERFIKVLLEYEVTYEQPRLWYTKGQTISAFLTRPGITAKDILSTRSCWQQRWNVRIDGKLRQCGLCAACLLRRMSMHAVHIDELVDTYTFADLTVTRYENCIPGNNHVRSNEMVEYGSAGVRHLQQLADFAGQPDAALRSHVFEIAQATNASEQDTSDNLRKLLMKHAEEWRDFVSAQGKFSFISNWIERGAL